MQNRAVAGTEKLVSSEEQRAMLARQNLALLQEVFAFARFSMGCVLLGVCVTLSILIVHDILGGFE